MANSCGKEAGQMQGVGRKRGKGKSKSIENSKGGGGAVRTVEEELRRRGIVKGSPSWAAMIASERYRSIVLGRGGGRGGL